MSDAIKALIEIAVNRGGGEAKIPRFIDTEKPQEEEPKESAEDVITRIKNNLQSI